jgi:hypothetical protein
MAGVFNTVVAGNDARLELLRSAIPDSNIQVCVNLNEDGVAGEFPGQSYENQPGQGTLFRSRPAAVGAFAGAVETESARLNEAVRSGVCLMTVGADSAGQRRLILEVMRKHGARYTGELGR